jgi:large subunit ribosomal protein L3
VLSDEDEVDILLGLIGKKLGMTQIFDESGNQVPVTVIEAGPCSVLDVRTPQKNGYAAVSLGFEKKDLKKVNKPQRGFFEKAGDSAYRVIREFRVSADEIDQFEPGQIIGADLFKIGDIVNVAGRSKGKGFTGVVKRWGFAGGKKTHGSRFHRAPGAIGMCADPARTLKGSRMAGHAGDARATAKNLTVLDVKPERNLILVKGAIPGARGGIVIIGS